METDESHEDRFVIIYDVLRLQENAAFRVALSIWHNYISNLYRDDVGRKSAFQLVNDERIRNKRKIIHLDECYKILKSLNLPKFIEKLLETELARITDDVKMWCRDLFYLLGEWVWDPHWCVWHPTRKIDYKLSAAKVLSNPGDLNNEQKFSIMSHLCMENEIVKFPIDSLPIEFIERAREEGNRLIDYWYHFAKNELHMMPRFPQEDEPISLNAEMAFDLIDCSWISFGYFWRRLNTEEQDSVASVKFDVRSGNFFDDLDQVLVTMSWQQQCRLLSLRFNEIIRKMVSRDRLQILRWAWRHFKHLINFETFSIIVHRLVSFFQYEEELMSWALDMWNSVPEQFKFKVDNGMISTESVSWGTFYNHEFQWPSRSAFKFTCKMFSMVNADLRRDIMLREGYRYGALVIYHDLMQELINICLPNLDDQRVFKKSVLESRKLEDVCIRSIHDANLAHIDMVLEFYLDMSNEIIEFKKQLLIRSKAIPEQFMYKIDTWYSLCVFIKEIYSGDDASIMETKKQLITSCVVNFTGCSGKDTDDVARFIQIVESVFTGDDLDIVKRTLLHSFQSKIHGHSWFVRFLNEKYFHRFVKWCVADFEYDFRALVDTIFDGVFSAFDRSVGTSIYGYDLNRFSSLSNLNECLIWYLKTDEEVKKYKLEKITSYQDMIIFQTLRTKNDTFNLRITLNWFFDNDELAVQQFESNMFKSAA